MHTLLLTRPKEQAAAFAAAVEARLPGRFRTIIAPLIAIAPIEARLELGDVAALAFTSVHGVAAFAARCPDRSRPAFCVGARTAAAARAAGFAARSAEGDARALAALIARERPASVLWVRGAHAAADLAGLLGACGIPARAVVLYEQRALAPPAAASALGRAGRIDVVAVFSPRSARLLVEAAREWDLGRSVTVAISPAADAPLGALAPQPARRLIAAAPSAAGILDCLAAL